MTDPETTERTTGGIAGKIVGKAKELAGEASGNENLAREGRLQQAQGEASRDAAEARAEEAAAGQGGCLARGRSREPFLQ